MTNAHSSGSSRTSLQEKRQSIPEAGLTPSQSDPQHFAAWHGRKQALSDAHRCGHRSSAVQQRRFCESRWSFFAALQRLSHQVRLPIQDTCGRPFLTDAIGASYKAGLHPKRLINYPFASLQRDTGRVIQRLEASPTRVFVTGRCRCSKQGVSEEQARREQVSHNIDH